MRGNLRDRLGRIRGAEKNGAAGDRAASEKRIPGEGGKCFLPAQAAEESSFPLWENAGCKTLKRVVRRVLPVPPPSILPPSMAILVRDFIRAGKIPLPGELLFFDLETTGLSGGAGTLAFLAAFGRFAAGEAMTLRDAAPIELRVTQYLLLDYPGEADFIENVVKEFVPRVSGAPPFLVSFNGKTFDSQILRTRCLMNGIPVPEYFHADLLHPARRLWKRVLPDCSQATIETSVLGLDRSGDVSGAFAPDIWFSFLKTGEQRELLSICDHNVRDITGLASLFLALTDIAAAPVKSLGKFRFDEEALALAWYKAARGDCVFFNGAERRNAEVLLQTAAGNGCPRAALVLAKDAEWRLKDFDLALRYTRLALAAQDIAEGLRDDLERRRERLEKKSRAAG